jgi:membrane protein implicated in regulation of membrane protease activity
MQEWWDKLTAVNQGFYIAAAFFSVFLVWQLIAALIGLAGGDEADADAAGTHDVDTDAGDVDAHEMDHSAASDAADSMSAFKLLSIRSILAFCTLFAWAGALYLQNGKDITWSILFAILWGAVAMVIVALIFHAMRKMTETGTIRLSSCVGTSGVVMLDIPTGGTGEARVSVNGTVQRLKARGVNGTSIPSGTPVIVQRLLGPDVLEVKPTDATDSSEKKGDLS